MMVNGQRAINQLDGMQSAMHMLQSGSGVPAALERFQGWAGFSFEDVELGIFRTAIPDVFKNDSGNVWTQSPGTSAIIEQLDKLYIQKGEILPA